MYKVAIVGIGSPVDTQGNGKKAFTGKNGFNHFKEWHALSLEDRVEISGICRRDQKQLQETQHHLSAEYGHQPAAHTDYRELIDEVKPDIVSVCTPDPCHYEIARFALENGANTVIEKPMTLRMPEAKELESIARKNDRRILLGTIFQKLRGYFGPRLANSSQVEYDIEFKGKPRKSKVYNIMPHIISTIPEPLDLRFTDAEHSDENEAIAYGTLNENANLVCRMRHRDQNFKKKKILVRMDGQQYDLSNSRMEDGKYYSILKEPNGNEKKIQNPRRELFRNMLDEIQQPVYGSPFVGEDGVRNTKLTCQVERLLNQPSQKKPEALITPSSFGS